MPSISVSVGVPPNDYVPITKGADMPFRRGTTEPALAVGLMIGTAGTLNLVKRYGVTREALFLPAGPVALPVAKVLEGGSADGIVALFDGPVEG